jgi:hypothetical protein
VALELDGVRLAVERILDDRLQVWRDVGGRDEGVLNDVTGELIPPMPGAALVWAGTGAVLPLDGPTVSAAQDGYQAVLPVGAALVRSGDVLVVCGSARGPQLRDGRPVGRRFLISDADVGTNPVVRVARLEPMG